MYKSTMERWLKTAKEKGATHIVVVCDTFSYEDYPVYVMPDSRLNDVIEEYNGPNMQRVVQIVDMTKMRES